jgi:RecA-family ATPase
MRVVRISDFLQEQDRVEWLVDNLLPDIGWTLLVGIQGLGKTTFAIQLCTALQHGDSFLGRATKQTDVMFIQADSVPAEWREIVRRVSPKGSKGLTLVDVPDKALGNVQYVTWMKERVAKYNPGFIVFDSLYSLTNININTEGILLHINLMKMIANDKPWLLIHHPPHNETRASGHNSVSANCSNVWELLKTKLKIAKGRIVKDKEIILSRDEQGLWCLRDKEEQDMLTEDILHKTIW